MNSPSSEELGEIQDLAKELFEAHLADMAAGVQGSTEWHTNITAEDDANGKRKGIPKPDGPPRPWSVPLSRKLDSEQRRLLEDTLDRMTMYAQQTIQGTHSHRLIIY